jgi:membrane-associated protease RseP (regulator of RpoE activity)
MELKKAKLRTILYARLSISIYLPTQPAGEKGHFSVGLVHGGAAEKAGLRRGDRLVWMNGAAVSDLTHSALTKMVRCSPAKKLMLGFVFLVNTTQFDNLHRVGTRR